MEREVQALVVGPEDETGGFGMCSTKCLMSGTWTAATTLVSVDDERPWPATVNSTPMMT